MRVIDSGHCYELAVLDGSNVQILQFVKREGTGYPGNVGTACGTTLQETLRACLDRLSYLDSQIPDDLNHDAENGIKSAIIALEKRAAIRHRRPESTDPIYGETCKVCLHTGCDGSCRTRSTV